MNEQQIIRKRFIQQFTVAIIRSIHPELQKKRAPLLPPEKLLIPTMSTTPKIQQTQQKPPAPAAGMQVISRQLPFMQRPLMRTMPQQRAILPTPPQTATVPLQSMARLAPFLADPAVATVECPGPGKQVMISRGGFIQATPMTLTKEEIDAIMKELSEKTRIPLGTGVFKAAWGETIVTAVISEFVGTRFIMQRKMLAQA